MNLKQHARFCRIRPQKKKENIGEIAINDRNLIRIQRRLTLRDRQSRFEDERQKLAQHNNK